MLKPWVEAGYECWAVDIRHPQGVNRAGDIVTVGEDVTRFLPPRGEYRIVFAFPPCTNLAVSGARWFRDKGLHGLADGIRLVEACHRICEWSGAPWMLENPVSTLATYWRPPDHTFHPWQYGGYLEPDGDGYTKRTCLWVGRDFVMPPARPYDGEPDNRIHAMPPSDERGDLRSVTPEGFARAVFLANEGKIDGLNTTLDLGAA